MVSRYLRLFAIGLAVLITAGAGLASLGPIPGEDIIVNATLSGNLQTADATPISHGTVNAFWVIYGGYVQTNLSQTGRFSITVTNDSDYFLSYFEYGESRRINGEKTTTSLSKNGIPDIYIFDKVTATPNRQLGTFVLPVGHPIQIRVMRPDGTPVQRANISVYHTYNDTDQGVGFGNVSVNDEGYASFQATNSTWIELDGTVLIQAETTGPGTQERVERTVEVNETTGVVNVTLP